MFIEFIERLLYGKPSAQSFVDINSIKTFHEENEAQRLSYLARSCTNQSQNRVKPMSMDSKHPAPVHQLQRKGDGVGSHFKKASMT